MRERFEPGIELVTGELKGTDRLTAAAELDRRLREFRDMLDRLGQSREISLAHTQLDLVGVWAAAHILKTESLGSTPAQRGAMARAQGR